MYQISSDAFQVFVALTEGLSELFMEGPHLTDARQGITK